jgi:hypothetical protein
VRIVTSSIEPLEAGRYRLSLILEDDIPRGLSSEVSLSAIGSGPIQSGAIPDRIVHALIQAGPPYSLSLSQIQKVVGGNSGTVNRQARTLAKNAPDLQIRLRGWVFSPRRGEYSLTVAAIRHVEGDGPGKLK